MLWRQRGLMYIGLVIKMLLWTISPKHWTVDLFCSAIWHESCFFVSFTWHIFRSLEFIEVMIAAAAGDNVRILAVDTSDEACKKAQPTGMGWNLKWKRAGSKGWSWQSDKLPTEHTRIAGKFWPAAMLNNRPRLSFMHHPFIHASSFGVRLIESRGRANHLSWSATGHWIGGLACAVVSFLYVFF